MTLTLTELIHPTALIDPLAEIAANVKIGPYSIIEGPVKIGPGTEIESHVCLSGPLTIGRDNFIGTGSILGKGPQHKGYRGEATELRIGNGNVIREYVTIHRGTVQGGGVTSLGDNNLLMVGIHLGHDVRMGNNCTVVNGALVAGHVQLDDGCILSGHSALQQRVRVGRLAMLGGLGSSSKDIPPFVLQQGYNCVTGLNIVGLRRAGVTADAIKALRDMFRIIYKEGRTLGSAIERAASELSHVPEVEEFLEFIRVTTTGINPCRSLNRTTEIA